MSSSNWFLVRLINLGSAAVNTSGLRSEGPLLHCIMTAFIFRPWCLCCTCFNSVQLSVPSYVINNTLIHASAASCICGSHADKPLWVAKTADFTHSQASSSRTLCDVTLWDIYWSVKLIDLCWQMIGNIGNLPINWPTAFSYRSPYCSLYLWQNQSHKKSERFTV